MRISNRGLDLIKRFEGLELEAYQDIVGIWTIGYGHTSMAGPPEVVPGMEISEQEAENILRRDLGQYEDGVERAVKVDISQNMFDALVSITYNIGVNGMKNSTFIKRLNNKDYIGAAEAMQWWNKAGGQVVRGLQRRREAEADLFLDGYEEMVGGDGVADDPRGAEIEENSPRRGSLTGSRTVGGATAAGGAGAIGAGSVFASNMGDDEEDAAAEEPATDDAGEETPVTDETPATGEDTGDSGEAETPAEDQAPAEDDDTDVIDPDAPAEEGTGTIIENAKEVIDRTFEDDEAWDSVIIAAGVIAVIAAIYVVIVRIDDWRNHKR